MTTEILTIDKGQCLTDVLPAIPANTIFDKTITGCGAFMYPTLHTSACGHLYAICSKLMFEPYAP